MPSKQIKVRRFDIVSAKPFDEVVAELTKRIGDTPPKAIERIHRTRNFDDFQKLIKRTVGPFGLMLFHRIVRSRSLRAGVLAITCALMRKCAFSTRAHRTTSPYEKDWRTISGPVAPVAAVGRIERNIDK
jgi:hypothetical protein